MRFRDVIGNGSLKEHISSIVDSGRVPHAVMFSEKDGYGALPVVMATIQYMTCGHRHDGDSCGECPDCKKISRMMHPDLHFAFPVSAPSGQDSPADMYADIWRGLYEKDPYFSESDLYRALGTEDKAGVINVAQAKGIISALSLKSYQGGNKYMVVWLPERMNAEAANRLLKIIEEPTERTYFFFVTHSPEKLLPTIRSRCAEARLHPAAPEEIAGPLMQRFSISYEDAAGIARISGGSYGAACRLLADTDAGSVYLPSVKETLDSVIAGDLVRLLENSERLAQSGRERQREFCLFFEEFLRKIFMEKIGAGSIGNVLSADRKAVASYASALGLPFFQPAFMALESALSALVSNVNPKMVFCDLANRLYMLK